MTDYKLVPVEPIRRAMDTLERFANDTLAGEKDALIHGRPLTRVERVGNVQYAKIPEMKGVDLDKYRAKASTFWRFS